MDAQKRMETDLRESEERFRGAFEFAAIGMALVAPDGRWLRVQPVFLREFAVVLRSCVNARSALRAKRLKKPCGANSVC